MTVNALNSADDIAKVKDTVRTSLFSTFSPTATWNERFTFNYPSTSRPSILRVTLWGDQRDGTNNFEHIGETEIDLDWSSNKKYVVPKWYPLVDDNEKMAGKIQLQISAESEGQSALIQTLHFSHLLELQVVEAVNVKKKDTASESDVFAQVSWGTQRFQTCVIEDNPSPKWLQTAHIWVDKEWQYDYDLFISLKDHDIGTSDELIGVAKIPAQTLFQRVGVETYTEEKVEGEEAEKEVDENSPSWVHEASGRANNEYTDMWLDIREDKEWAKYDIDLQKREEEKEREGEDLLSGLGDFLPSSSSSEVDINESLPSTGRVLIRYRLLSRPLVEEKILNKLVANFDEDNDGRLDVSEVHMMFQVLDFDLSLSDVQSLFSLIDENKNGFLDVSEVGHMIRAVELKDEHAASRILSYLGEGGSSGAPSALMARSRIPPGEIIVRETGKTVREFVPVYVRVALKAASQNMAGKKLVQSNTAASVFKNLSVQYGEKFNSPESKDEIARFIRTYNIDLKEVEKDLKSFKNFNQFFSRTLREGARPIAEPEADHIAVCPADSRLTVFSTVEEAASLWVKGDEFSVKSILGPRIAHKFVGGYVFSLSFSLSLSLSLSLFLVLSLFSLLPPPSSPPLSVSLRSPLSSLSFLFFSLFHFFTFHQLTPPHFLPSPPPVLSL